MAKTIQWKKLWPTFYLLIILLLAGFLRLYRIRDYMGFLGDEGRDVLVVKHMIVDHKFTLLGPITSVGLMHLGPIYYYFMAPFLLFSQLDPIGPAIMVALFSLATIWLIWKLSIDYFSPTVGLIAALLYACSPMVIIYSHSSWNPNILPFWALVIIYGMLKVVIERKYNWLFIVGLAFGIVIQLHYVAFIFLPICLSVFLFNRAKTGIKSLFTFGVGTFITFSPFIIFELRNKFVNSLSVYHFIIRTGDAKTFALNPIFNLFWDLTVRLFWRPVVIENAEISIVFLLIILIGCIYFYWNNRRTIQSKALGILLIWFFVGLGGLSFYTGNIYDYYLLFALPLPFLLSAIILAKLKKNVIGKCILLVTLVALLYFELKATPISKSPNRLALQTETIAQFILQKTDSQPYNFALIADKNSDHAYRYFLEVDGYAPVVIKNPTEDPDRKTVMSQLLVVCEEKICQPLGHPLWEIAGFGRAEIAEVSQVGVVKVFKLVHFKEKSG